MSKLGPSDVIQIIKGYSLNEPRLNSDETPFRERLSKAKTMEDVTGVIKDYITKAIDQEDEMNSRRLVEALQVMIPLLEDPASRTPSLLVQAANAALIQCAWDRCQLKGPTTELGEKWREINSLLTFGYFEAALPKIKSLRDQSRERDLALFENILKTVNDYADYFLVTFHVNHTKEELIKKIETSSHFFSDCSERYPSVSPKEKRLMVDDIFDRIDLLKKIVLDYPDDEEIRSNALRSLKELSSSSALDFIKHRAKDTLSEIKTHSAPARLETTQASREAPPRQKRASITLSAQMHMTTSASAATAAPAAKSEKSRKHTWVKGSLSNESNTQKNEASSANVESESSKSAQQNTAWRRGTIHEDDKKNKKPSKP